jgi:hypothetical protein
MSQHDPANNETEYAGDCDPKAKAKLENFHIHLYLLVKKNATIGNSYDPAFFQGLDERLGLLDDLLVGRDLGIGLGKLLLELLLTLLVLLFMFLILGDQVLQLCDLICLLCRIQADCIYALSR